MWLRIVTGKHPSIKTACDEMEEDYRVNQLGIPNIKFSKRDLLAVKYADILSGIYFTSSRVRAGDQEANQIRDKWLEYIGGLPFLSDEAEQAILELK